MSILGIDLGTTNCACSAWVDGKLVKIPNRLGSLTTPSVVGLDDKNNLVFGDVAKERLISHPSQTVALFKRLMGSNASVKLNKRVFTPPELSSLLLRALKEDAENHLSTTITDAVISVPAYFNENQRVATKTAGSMAGLRVNRLINEPTAAALAYGLNEREEGRFIILDMGGGTFDVSILEYFSGVMEVHASAGDNFLGGENIVDALLQDVCKQLNVSPKSLPASQVQSLHKTLEQYKRKAKVGYVETLNIKIANEAKTIELNHDWFLRMATPTLLRAKQPIQRALADAAVQSSDIDDVILVGGTTKLHAFRQLVTQLFGKLPSCNLDPDLVVSMGAGIQAGLIQQDDALDDVVLTDVCPFTLGTEVVNEQNEPGYFMPIIERNTIVPVSIERTVFTVHDNQTKLQIGVFQGENRLTKDNVFLGHIDLKVPESKAGEEGVAIRYSYDMNGLLDIDVTILSTGEVISKTIQNASGVLSDEQVKKSRDALAKLKFHPREDEHVLQVLTRGERIYQNLIGQDREYLGQALSRFDAVLNRQNRQEIQRAMAKLAEVLDSFDTGEWI